jgi:hypothetical protein
VIRSIQDLDDDDARQAWLVRVASRVGRMPEGDESPRIESLAFYASALGGDMRPIAEAEIRRREMLERDEPPEDLTKAVAVLGCAFAAKLGGEENARWIMAQVLRLAAGALANSDWKRGRWERSHAAHSLDCAADDIERG